MFEMWSCGPARGDDTEPYSIRFIRKDMPTVREFVDYILVDMKNTWGEVCITTNSSIKSVWQLLGVLDNRIKYSHSKLINGEDVLDKYGDRKIIFASADGGWTKYDYVLVVE